MSDANWKAARLDVKPGSTPEQAADAVRKVLNEFTFNQWTDGPTGQLRAGATSHSPESITSTISALESLAETLPAVLTVANGWAPADIKFHNRDAMHSAVDMLRKYRDIRRNEGERLLGAHEEAKHHALMAQFETARIEGIAEGIAQEQARAKEARKGRKRGAKKS